MARTKEILGGYQASYSGAGGFGIPSADVSLNDPRALVKSAAGTDTNIVIDFTAPGAGKRIVLMGFNALSEYGTESTRHVIVYHKDTSGTTWVEAFRFTHRQTDREFSLSGLWLPLNENTEVRVEYTTGQMVSGQHWLNVIYKIEEGTGKLYSDLSSAK